MILRLSQSPTLLAGSGDYECETNTRIRCNRDCNLWHICQDRDLGRRCYDKRYS